jgi:hypothetical protein
LVLVGLSSACASNNDRGRALYADGRYIEAAELFEHSEPQLGDLESRERTRYGLYRGMTLLRLGDLDRAAKWLYFAQAAAARDPSSMELSERNVLRHAWQMLDNARALSPESPDPLRDAIARSSAASTSSAPDVVSADEPPPPSPKQLGAAEPTPPNP